MALTNNLRKQVDLPVWEWARFAPAVSSALSCSCVADNTNFNLLHGRYIYYLISATAFWRYDTWSDGYEQLASPSIALTTVSSMRFAGARGYEGRVLSATSTTFVSAGLSGKTLKGFDVRIVAGTGVGQHRIVTDVSANPIMADFGTASAVTTSSITDSTKAWQFNQWAGYQVRFTISTGATQVRKILYNNATSITWADAAKYPEDLNANSVLATALAVGTTYQIESSTFTVDTAWTVTPDATSRFLIESGGIYLATTQATSNFAYMYYDIAADIWYIKTASSTIISTAPTDLTLERTTENASIWDRGTATSGTTTTLVDTTKSWTTNQWAGYYVRVFTGTGEGQLRPIVSNTNTTLTWSSAGTAPDTTTRYFITGFDAGTASSAGSESSTAVVTASAIGNTLTVTGVTSGTLFPGMQLTGSGVSPLLLFSAATSSAAVITVASTTGVQVGMAMTMVSGTGTLPAGVTTVISVNSGTTFTVSQAPSVALSAGVFILSGGTTAASLSAFSSAVSSSVGSTITTASTVGLSAGMGVIVSSGTGSFTTGTVVTAVTSATTFTVSIAPSVILSGATVVAAWPMACILGTQISGSTGGTGTYLLLNQHNFVSTTVTGTGVAYITDLTKSWALNRWNGLAVRITSGTGKGQVRQIIGTYGTTLQVSPNWTTTPDSTSVYEIQGDIDRMYLMAGASAQTFLYHLGADILTTGRLKDYGIAAWANGQYGSDPAHAITSGTYANPTMTVVTVNNHNFKTGQTIVHKGDTGAGASLNNVSATITVIAANTYTYNVGPGSASMTVTVQTTSSLKDASKSWVINQFAGCIVTFTTGAVTQATGIATVTSAYIIGNDTNTLYFVVAAGAAPVSGASRYVITMPFVMPQRACVGTMHNNQYAPAYGDGLCVGTQSTTTLVDQTKLFTSIATSCSSSGTTVTTTGNLRGLQVGMYLAVTVGTGAFVIGAGTNTTGVYVASIISDTQFTVSATPTTTLSGATITATFWPTNAFVNRKLRFLCHTGQYQELIITANTTTTLTFGVATAGVSGATAYAILENPVRSTGMEMNWLFGTSDLTTRGSYMICPRGGATPAFDRLNLQTDNWELLSTTPQFETFTTGSYYAYDGGDRMYITKEATQRMYYLDVNTNILHSAGLYPYTAGTAVLGNRMEVFTTADGLKYLWLNRHSNVECFKQLLFY